MNIDKIRRSFDDFSQTSKCYKAWYELRHEKTCSGHSRTRKGVEQPAHTRSLISTFVVRRLDSITPIVAISEIPRLQLASVAEQTGLSLASLSAHLVKGHIQQYLMSSASANDNIDISRKPEVHSIISP